MNLGGVGKVEGTASTISVNSHFPHVKCYKSIVMANMILVIVVDRQAVPRSDDGAPGEDGEGSPLQHRGQQRDCGRHQLPDSLRHPR